MNAIELAKEYAGLASEKTPGKVDRFDFNNYAKIDHPTKVDASISKPAQILLEAALNRVHPYGNIRVGLGNHAGRGLYVTGNFDEISVHQVKQQLNKIQEELGTGWKKENGKHVNEEAFARDIIPYILKSVNDNIPSTLFYKVGDERKTGEELRKLMDASTQNASLINAPAVVVLTEAQVNKEAEIIGFKSPARQK